MKEKFFNLANLIKSSTSFEIEEFEDECDYHFNIYANNESYWMYLSKDEKELTAGFGYFHQHFYHDESSLEEGLKYFIKLISNEIIKTYYFRGDDNYKITIDIQYPDRIEGFGSTGLFSYKFWKKKSLRFEILPAIISPDILNAV